MWILILLKFWQAVTCWCSSRPPLSRLRTIYAFVQLLCPGNCCLGHSTGDCSASRGHLGLWGNQTVQAPLREPDYVTMTWVPPSLSSRALPACRPCSCLLLLIRHVIWCSVIFSCPCLVTGNWWLSWDIHCVGTLAVCLEVYLSNDNWAQRVHRVSIAHIFQIAGYSLGHGLYVARE